MPNMLATTESASIRQQQERVISSALVDPLLRLTRVSVIASALSTVAFCAPLGRRGFDHVKRFAAVIELVEGGLRDAAVPREDRMGCCRRCRDD